MTEVIKTYYENGNLKKKYTLVNGKREGLYQYWDENGYKLLETSYLNGKENGLNREWHLNGKIWWEATFVNGKIEGIQQEWWENGQKMIECTFVAGKREGLYQRWDIDGSIIEISFFINDEEIEFKVLAKEQLNIFMEELMAKLFHPDRLERIAKQYNIDAIDYLDCLE